MTTVNLTKGQAVELTKGTTINKITAGLGWDMKIDGGPAFDLDLFLVQLGADKKALDNGLIFYGNKKNANGSAEVGEDNLTGEGDGYDEQAFITLKDLPEDVAAIAVGVSIYDAAGRSQDFGHVESAFADIVDDATGEKLASYDLSLALGENTGIVIGQFVRDGGDFKFVAIGEAVMGGMPEIVTKYGMTIA